MKNFILKIKSSFSLNHISPHSHWKNILHIFSVLIIILILFSFYLLYEINREQIFKMSSVKVDQSTLINEKLLKKVTESFNNKILKEKEIKDGLHQYKDPSIN